MTAAEFRTIVASLGRSIAGARTGIHHDFHVGPATTQRWAKDGPSWEAAVILRYWLKTGIRPSDVSIEET